MQSNECGDLVAVGRSVRAKCPDSVTDSAQIRGSNVVAKAYVSEETQSFAAKVEIIRKVPTVRGPNDFGKSRV
jgi:hypothetical protein